MKENGGPAFPQNDASVNRINNLDGMSLRDYFAGQALQGIWACPLGPLPDDNPTYEKIALYAYKQADEMLKARNT